MFMSRIATPIICVNTGQTFRSQSDAAIRLKINQGNLGSHIKGKLKSVGGMMFRKMSFDECTAEWPEYYTKVMGSQDEPAFLAQGSAELYENTPPRGLPFKCVNTGQKFLHHVQAVKVLGVRASNLSSVLSGNLDSTGGKVFRKMTRAECCETWPQHTDHFEAMIEFDTEDARLILRSPRDMDYLTRKPGRGGESDMPMVCNETGHKFIALDQATRETLGLKGVDRINLFLGMYSPHYKDDKGVSAARLHRRPIRSVDEVTLLTFSTLPLTEALKCWPEHAEALAALYNRSTTQEA